MPSEPFAWEPVDTASLAGVDDPLERAELRTRLERFLSDRLQPWLRKELESADSRLQRHRSNGVVWQLVVEAGKGERIEWFIDYSAEPLVVASGRHRFPNDFTHVAGRTLLEVLRGQTPGLFWLVGDARSYEKTIGVADGRLFAPAGMETAEDELGDPMTFFLRHFGPDADGRPMAPMEPAEPPMDPEEIEVLARQGEGRAVLAKKVLLCLLAARDAARLGIAPAEADVQSASDVFRRRFGLEDADDMNAWLAEVGLDLPGYSRAMYGFAAVTRTQARWSAEIESLIGTYAKVASVRNRDR